MGHTEIARLPTSRRWAVVVDLLHAPQLNAPSVAGAVTHAAERRLQTLSTDPSVTYCFWLLTRLAAAARGPDFVADVAQLGIPTRPDDSALRFLARVGDHTREQLGMYPGSGPFGEIAAIAVVKRSARRWERRDARSLAARWRTSRRRSSGLQPPPNSVTLLTASLPAS